MAAARPLEGDKVTAESCHLFMVVAEDVFNGVEGPPAAVLGFGEAPAILVEDAEAAKNMGDVEIQGTNGLLAGAPDRAYRGPGR